jgi:hypothetical protein
MPSRYGDQPAQVVTTQPVVSSGKQPVEQPRSRAARDVKIVQAPSAMTSVSVTQPHTSTVPNRGVQ